MNFLYLILLGYLIGSASPGYFFGKIFKGIDIRKYGSGETGATNTYRFVGPAYGIIAGVIDALKAVFAYYVVVLFLSPDLSILVGLAAVVGHIFPFYLGFKGGKGAASLFGLNFIVIIFTQSFYALLLLIGSVIYSAIISEERGKIWTAPFGRLTAKISALALPLGFIWFSGFVISFAAVLLFIFLFFDVVRFLAPKVNRRYLGSKKFAKEKEFRRLSGYSLFLISAFLLFNFFPKEIAVASLVFFIVGDVLAPAGQLRYMPHQKVLGDKTLGGALVIFIFSLLAGLFLRSLTPLALTNEIMILGAFLAASLDQLSIFIDDNLLVPLGAASLLWISGLAKFI